MNWFAILMPFFLDLIEQCQEDRDPAEIEAGLNNPGTTEQMGMFAVIRKKHPRWRVKKVWRRVDKGMAILSAAPPTKIRAMMAEVAARAN